MDERAKGAEEAGWIELCKKGDRNALSLIYERYKDRVYSLALRMLCNPEEAEDLTHDTFVKVFREIRNFKGQSALYTWMFRITVSLCLNHIHRKKIVTFKQLSPVIEPEEHRSFEETEEKVVFERLLASLEPKYRICIVLKDIEGISYVEIASLLGLPFETIVGRVHLARQKLKEAYKRLKGI